MLCVLDVPGLVRPSTSHLMLFVSLEGTRAELQLPAANLWITDEPDAVAAQRNYEQSDGSYEDGFPGIFLSVGAPPSTSVS